MIDISVKDLVKFFVIGENLLDGLSFEVQEGERVAILGRNGCGKTTLFKIITGEMEYDSGEVFVNPHKKLGLISQIPHFPEGYTVEDVLRSAFLPLMKTHRRMQELEAAMSEGAERGWKSTEGMQAKLGRAARLGERSIGHLDAGATSCYVILSTLAKEISARL